MRCAFRPRLGIAGGVLFKGNCQGIPIITQPCKERKIREHNTDMTETRATRVEQNTGERPSLPPFTKCIDALIKIRDIVISQIPTKTCSTMEQSSTSPATNNAIRGAEQKR